MTLSRNDRDSNADLALRMMLQELPEDRPYEWVEVDGDKDPFLSIFPTTWKDLVRRGLVKEHTFNRYQLTGHGWISALKLCGKFDSQEFKEKAGKLRAALRKSLRKSPLGDRKTDERVTMVYLQNETGLPESFIYNAIDSHLLYHLFNMRDVQWAPDDEMMK